MTSTPPLNDYITAAPELGASRNLETPLERPVGAPPWKNAEVE